MLILLIKRQLMKCLKPKNTNHLLLTIYSAVIKLTTHILKPQYTYLLYNNELINKYNNKTNPLHLIYPNKNSISSFLMPYP